MAYNKQTYLDNKEKIIKKSSDYYWKNRDSVRRTQAEYNRNNRHKINARRRELQALSVEVRLKHKLRYRLRQALQGGRAGHLINENLGCSIVELRQYLESKWQPGMSWENYGANGWHIDHIIPLSWFNLMDSNQIQIAINYTNLQPLWAADNLRKGATTWLR